LIHKLRVAKDQAIGRYGRNIIAHMKTKVQGFIHAKAGAFASIGKKVRQCLTS
jgi:hypothetical protein